MYMKNIIILHNILSQQKITCTGLRKKRAAPPPPTLRPLSSAISTQALERIVDSEELLTSDIEPSKSAVIGVPSKTNSDTDCPKINSNIGISAQSMRQLDYELKSEITCESDCDIQQNCTAEANTKARSKTDLVNSELVKTEVIALVEATPRVEQTRVAAKRGKLEHTANNLYALLCNSKTSEDPQVGEGTNIDEKTFHVTLYPRKYRFSGNKLHAAIKKCHSQCDNSASVNFVNDISVGIVTQITDQLLRICQNSQDLKRIKLNSRHYHVGTISFDNCELLTNRSNKCTNCDNSYTKIYNHMSKHLAKIQTSVNDIKSDMKCEVLKSTLNPKLLHSSSYVCRGKYSKKDSSYNMNFQNNMILKEIKLSSFFKNSNLTSSQNFCLKHFKTMNSLEFLSYSPKLDKINTTKCHTNSIVSCENRKSRNCSKQYAENNLYPPPLSTLQIFAISTKPLDIQMRFIESIPSDINELPSLPIINYTENKLPERKLSILEPPPPGLVSRQESNESWNRFLVQLNSILENRIGEFV